MTLRKLLAISTIVALGLLAGCSGGGETPDATESADAGSGAAFSVDPATAGTITGKVSFSGKAPRRGRINMSAETSCAQAHGGPIPTEDFVPNDNGTIRYAFVYIKSDFGGASFPVPEEPVVLDQKDCLYSPHVVGAMAGQTIRFLNSDTVTHNVHPVPENNREWNVSQPPNSDPIEKSFARPELLLAVKCNVHPWMRAYIGVMKHPYFAVTGSDGTFTIGNLPPGDYTVVSWQEKLGEQEIQVTIGDSETKEIELAYTGS